MYQVKNLVKAVLCVSAWLTLISAYPCLSASAKPAAKEPLVVDDCIYPHKFPWIAGLIERIYSDWAPSEPVDRSAIVTFTATPDGRLYDVHVSKSSEGRQFDADCIQAVLAAAVYAPSPSGGDELSLCNVTFDSSKKVGHKGGSISRYWELHSKEKDEFVAVYRVPLDVLIRYPGLFKDSDLLDSSNLGFINDENRVPNKGLSGPALYDIKRIYTDTWIPFFLKHSVATKEEIWSTRDNLTWLTTINK